MDGKLTLSRELEMLFRSSREAIAERNSHSFNDILSSLNYFHYNTTKCKEIEVDISL